MENVIKIVGGLSVGGLSIDCYSVGGLSDNPKKAKWPIYFISRKLLQKKGQMVTLVVCKNSIFL
jgi:hypothetical protein